MSFIVDREGFTNVYVDGCYLYAGTSRAAAGYGIYWGPNNSNNVSGPSRSDATNTVAEIQAATLAINQANRLEIRKLRVHTDLQAIVEAVDENIQKWKANGWRSLWDGQPVANRREYEDLDRAIRQNPNLVIKIEYIPSNLRNPHHTEADHLARRGAEQRR